MPDNVTPSPGRYSTEWWGLLASKLIALVALTGIFTSGDVAGLQDAIGKAIAAAGIVVAQAMLVYGYICHRTSLKQAHLDQEQVSVPAKGDILKLPLLLALVGAGLLCGQALGDSTPGVSTFTPAAAPAQTGSLQIGLLNCCPKSNQPQQQAPAAQPSGPDPTTISMLQQVLGNQQLILTQLAALSKQTPPAGSPSPSPQIYLVPGAGGGAPYNPQPLAPGYAPNPIGGGGYAPVPLAPGYAPNPLPPGFAPSPQPPGYAPRPIGGPGYNPQPLAPASSTPPAAQPQRYTDLYTPIPTQRSR